MEAVQRKESIAKRCNLEPRDVRRLYKLNFKFYALILAFCVGGDVRCRVCQHEEDDDEESKGNGHRPHG
jgi:hypothetical protein